MKKLVICDPDQGYIKSYEKELVRKYSDKLDIQIITTTEYLDEYFAEKKYIDILIIAREFYGAFIKDHELSDVLILDQEISLEVNEEGEEYSTFVKYTSVEELFNFIEKAMPGEALVQPEIVEPKKIRDNSQVIAVYSPVGGSGKSLVAFALAKKIKKLGESVITIGCDDLQSIGIYLENRQNANETLASKLKNPSDDTYFEVLKNVSVEGTTCLLPFEKPLSVLGVGKEELVNLVNLFKEKKDFQYIILDLGVDMSETNRALMSASDVCVVVTETNVPAIRKVEKLMMNQEVFPIKKSVMIANQLRSDGIHFSAENVYGSLSPYDNVDDAMEDPLFYRLALELTE